MNEFKANIKYENKSERTKKKNRRISREVRLMVFKTIMSLVPAGFIAFLTIPAAYRYRGYSAIGGEWLLIILTFAFSFNIISNYIKEIIRKERRERKYYQSK